LTAKPASIAGNKIPNGLGMKVSDTNTFAYNATFKFIPGKTPCNVPLSAINTARLIVDNPGDAPLPEPQQTVTTVVFTGCKRVSEARIGRVVPAANVSARWALAKTANVTTLRIKRGGSAGIMYKVVPVKKAPISIKYSVSGSVLISPRDGVMGGPPLKVKSVVVKLSSGNSAPAKCFPANPDGSTGCRFDAVPYGIKTIAPDAGSAAATVTLEDGSVLKAPAQPFDFTDLPMALSPGSRATLSDAFDPKSVKALKAAGINVHTDESKMPPGAEFGVPLVIGASEEYKYAARIKAGKKCGTFKLANVARLTPADSEQKALEVKDEVKIEVYGC